MKTTYNQAEFNPPWKLNSPGNNLKLQYSSHILLTA